MNCHELGHKYPLCADLINTGSTACKLRKTNRWDSIKASIFGQTYAFTYEIWSSNITQIPTGTPFCLFDCLTLGILLNATKKIWVRFFKNQNFWIICITWITRCRSKSTNFNYKHGATYHHQRNPLFLFLHPEILKRDRNGF